MSEIDKSDGQAVIEDGYLTIRVAIAALPAVVEGAWAAGGMDVRYKVTDAQTFAKDLMYELNAESENGTTRIHTMFDAAIQEAINHGAQGIDEHEDQDA
jgi:hypothetical protein